MMVGNYEYRKIKGALPIVAKSTIDREAICNIYTEDAGEAQPSEAL